MAMAVPYIVGRRVQPPDGTTVVVEVTGGAGRVLSVAMQGTRANALDSVPASPDAKLVMDVETFLCLCCGRWDPAETIAAGRVEMSGDRNLGETIAREMNIMI
jgi:putative sterol carrier protein